MAALRRFRFLLVAALAAAAVLGGVRLLAAPDDPGGRALPPVRVLTLHAWGIGVRTHVSAQGPAHGHVIEVVDLGPDVAGLRADLRPTDAQVTVSGHPPIALTRLPDGRLQATVPASHFQPLGLHAVRLRIHSGTRLVAALDVGFLLQ